MENIAKDLALLQLIPRNKFDELVEYWEVDKGVTSLDAFKFTSVLVLSSIFEHKSIRDVESACGIAKSTLGDALRLRPYGFFEDLVAAILEELSKTTPDRRERRALRELLAVDSSVCNVHGSLWRFESWKIGKRKAALKFHAVWNINKQWIEDFRITGTRRSDLTIAKTLNLQSGKIYVFDRAYFDFGFWLKIEQAGSHFVSRIKRSGQRLSCVHKSLGEDIKKSGIIYDGFYYPGEDACYRARKPLKQIKFRHIIYRDKESEKLFDFITSDFTLSAQTIADIYRKRWAVELLFRWLKGHLNIRRFSMKNKNAIRIQLAIAVIVQLLLRLKMLLEKKWISAWKLLRCLRTSLQRTHFQICLNSAFQTHPNTPQPARAGPKTQHL